MFLLSYISIDLFMYLLHFILSWKLIHLLIYLFMTGVYRSPLKHQCEAGRIVRHERRSNEVPGGGVGEGGSAREGGLERVFACLPRGH